MLQRRLEVEEVEVREFVEEAEVAEEAGVAKNIHRGLNASQTGKSPTIYPHIT